MDLNALLTPEELADRWCLKPVTLRNWRSAKPRKGPKFIRLNGRVRGDVAYRMADVLAWENKNTK